MDFFDYRRGTLHCEGVPLAAVAEGLGTPTYVYSLGTVLHHLHRLTEAFRDVDHQVYYSVKANSNLGLMAALAREGCGFDVFSGGELFRVKKAGAAMDKVVFAGVGKTEPEMELGVRSRIQMFNIESWPEAVRLDAIARRLGRRVVADFRVNPDVDAHTHAHITTGTAETKFGVPLAEAVAMYDRARRELRNVELSGVHLHIGSQITKIEPYRKALRKTLDLVEALRARGHRILTLNLGGGLGIIYRKERTSTALQFAKAVIPLLRGHGLKLLIEPGRFIVGNAGVLLTRVLYVKPARGKTFVIVDSGMNDLIRPALYGAHHEILPVDGRRRRAFVRHVAAREERLQPVVERAGQDHPGEDLAALGGGQRRADGGAAQEPFTRANDLLHCGGEAIAGADPGRRLANSREIGRREASAQLGPERAGERVDGRGIARCFTSGRVERGACGVQGKWKAFDDERREPRGKLRRWGRAARLGHALMVMHGRPAHETGDLSGTDQIMCGQGSPGEGREAGRR